MSAGSSALDVYLEDLSLTNTTTNGLPAKDTLSTTGLPSTVESTYTVDVLRTLLIATESIVYTSGNASYVVTTDTSVVSGKTYYTTNDNSTYTEATGLTVGTAFSEGTTYYETDKQLWDPEALANRTLNTANTTTATWSDTLAGSSAIEEWTAPEEGEEYKYYNAHKYYNAVTGANPAIDETDKTADNNTSKKVLSTSTGDTTNAITVGSAPTRTAGTTKYLKVTFKVFINGWDLACFDACMGQNFTVDMEFTSDSNNSNIIKYTEVEKTASTENDLLLISSDHSTWGLVSV